MTIRPVQTRTDQPTVLEFTAAGAGELALVGGKVANLAELIRAGLPVPAGFCVTTRAYQRVADGAELGAVLDELAATPPDALPRLASLAAAARELLLAAPVPPDLAADITDAYRRFGGDAPVAVRSSATAEDLPFASFAGQQDTYLNVVGADAVLDAVRRCWASLWTDRAVTYRATNGIDHGTVRLAVAVQAMVDAEVAGVLFTADPVTGRRRQAVIDASPGLGEAVVSGAVNPDHFVVDTATGTILERRIGDKRLAIRPLPGGGTEQVAPADPEDACVTDEQLAALVALGQRVEAHYGAPQDTEWAIDGGGKLWLTQARPITTLYPLPGEEPDRVFFNFSVAQGVYRPVTPMGLAAFRLFGSSVSDLFGFPLADPLAGPTLLRHAGGRIFIDVTPIVRSTVGRAIAPRVLDLMEARSAVVMRQLFDDPRFSVTQPSRWPFVRRAARIAVRYQVPLRALEGVLRPAAARARAERIRAELDRVPAGADPFEAVQGLLSQVAPLLPRIMPAVGAGFGLLGLASKLLGDAATRTDLQSVLRGLPHNITTEMDLALWRLATEADGDTRQLLLESTGGELTERYRAGTLPPALRDGLAAFLDEYGHRAVAEIDLGLPRWSDDPTYLFGVLANYLRLDDPALAPDALFARGAAEAEAMIAELTARARRRGRIRARVVGFALRRARELAGLRELPKYYLVVAVGHARRQLAQVGVELAAAGRLGAADDVFFVDLAEARAGLAGTDLRGLVRRRREEYERELRRRHLPRLLLSDGTEPEAVTRGSAAPDGALTGTPASAGRVTGVARVILDPVGAHLAPGEILVAPSTDPGWTPLFLTASGLVMEMGGANSHGAVVAREYGIPAVVGVADAVSRISTGDRITVDGSAGTITVSSPEPT